MGNDRCLGTQNVPNVPPAPIRSSDIPPISRVMRFLRGPVRIPVLPQVCCEAGCRDLSETAASSGFSRIPRRYGRGPGVFSENDGWRANYRSLKGLAADGGPRDAMGRAARKWQLRRCINRWSAAMPQPNDLSRSLVALDQNSTIIAVVELSQSSWLVGGVVPGIERQPCKKLEPSPERLLAVLHHWRDEAVRARKKGTRSWLAVQAGPDGFLLARRLEARGGEGDVSPPPS